MPLGSFSELPALTRTVVRDNLRRFFLSTPESGGLRLESLFVVYALLAGISMALPYNVLDSAGIYAGLKIAPEWAWAVLFITAAGCKFFGFLFDLTRVRFLGAMLLTFAISFMWYCYVITPIARMSLAIVTVTVLLIGQISITITMTRSRFRGGAWTRD